MLGIFHRVRNDVAACGKLIGEGASFPERISSGKGGAEMVEGFSDAARPALVADGRIHEKGGDRIERQAAGYSDQNRDQTAYKVIDLPAS